VERDNVGQDGTGRRGRGTGRPGHEGRPAWGALLAALVILATAATLAWRAGRPVGGMAPAGSAPLTTVAYASMGREQRFVVPTGVTALRIVAVGGRGADGQGGHAPPGAGAGVRGRP